MNRKILPIQELPCIYLKPGDMHFGLEPARVVTVLGSCVSVTMYCRAERIGAMCHAVMPWFEEAAGKGTSSQEVFQYVDSSMEWMLVQFARIGIMKKDIEVKIFGGSEIFSGGNPGSGYISLGPKNVEAARKAIHEQNLKLKAWDVGGAQGRKVIFYTDTGDVFTKPVTKVDQRSVIITYGRNR
jgi:chemotaxis protein CheD